MKSKLLKTLKDKTRLFLKQSSSQKLFLWASALLFNYFFILRLGQYQYDFPANDLFAAFSHDARFVFYLVIYIILGMFLLRFFRIKELGKGFVIALLLLSFFISVFQNFLYTYHSFSSGMLGFQLLQEYIDDVIFFLPSIGGGDFDMLNFAGIILLWNALVFFLVLYPFQEKQKKWILRCALALFCISILYDQTKQALYPNELRDRNHILYFWSTKSKMHLEDVKHLLDDGNASQSWKIAPQGQALNAKDKTAGTRSSQFTSFERCLQKKYHYPKKRIQLLQSRKGAGETKSTGREKSKRKSSKRKSSKGHCICASQKTQYSFHYDGIL